MERVNKEESQAFSFSFEKRKLAYFFFVAKQAKQRKVALFWVFLYFVCEAKRSGSPAGFA